MKVHLFSDVYCWLACTALARTKATVTSTIRVRFACNSTALRPFDDLRHHRTPTCVFGCCAATYIN